MLSKAPVLAPFCAAPNDQKIRRDGVRIGANRLGDFTFLDADRAVIHAEGALNSLNISPEPSFHLFFQIG
jgi:hypothetical protein